MSTIPRRARQSCPVSNALRPRLPSHSSPSSLQIKAVIITRERDERDKLVQGGYLTKNASHKDREYSLSLSPSLKIRPCHFTACKWK